jgi:hypothetical protein
LPIDDSLGDGGLIEAIGFLHCVNDAIGATTAMPNKSHNPTITNHPMNHQSSIINRQ